MKRIMRKLKSRAGFTLAETLITVVILLLVSSVVATGMPAAVSAYRNAIDAANAQVLLSATVDALRGELTTARDVTVESDGTTILYYSADTGSRSKLARDSSKTGCQIMLQEYDDFGDTNAFIKDSDITAMNGLKPAARPLVSDAMTRTTKDSSLMTVSYGGVSIDKGKGVVTITGLSVKRGDTEIAKMPDTGLVIRVLTAAGGGGT